MSLTNALAPETEIEYRYLNMDKRKFYSGYKSLIASLRNSDFLSYMLRTIPNVPKYNQCLIVGGLQCFTKQQAINLCREIAFKKVQQKCDRV